MPPKSLPSLLSLLLYPQSQWMISFSSLLALILWLFDDNLSCPRGYLSRIPGTLETLALDNAPRKDTTREILRAKLCTRVYTDVYT